MESNNYDSKIFHIIKKEELKKIHPQRYNIDVLKSYHLMDKDLNTSFLYYYSCYKFYLENYLKKVLNLTELNEKIQNLSSNNKYNVYQTISYLGFDKIFICNNIFLDRLTPEEFKEYQVIYNNRNEEQIEKFIINTFKKLIVFDSSLDNDVPVNYISDREELIKNNALIIGLDVKATPELESYLKKLEQEYSKILDIPVNIIIYANNGIYEINNLNYEHEQKAAKELTKHSKYLPIGSIVILKNSWKKIMIMGFSPRNMDNSEIYDYLGCLYPEGIIRTDYNILFNHQDIKEIIAIGLIDEEQKSVMKTIETLIKNQAKN